MRTWHRRARRFRPMATLSGQGSAGVGGPAVASARKSGDRAGGPSARANRQSRNRFADRRRRRQSQHQPGRVSRQPRDLHAAAGQPDLRHAARVERGSCEHRNRRSGNHHRSDLTGTQRFSGRVTGVLNQINPGSTDFQVKVLLAESAAATPARHGRAGRDRRAPGRRAFAFRQPRLPTTTTTRS